MPHTSGISGASLVPQTDFSGITSNILRAFEFREQREEREREGAEKVETEKERREIIQGLSVAGLSTQDETNLINRYIDRAGPVAGKALIESLNRGDTVEIAENTRITEKSGRLAKLLLDIKDPIKRQRAITQEFQRASAKGETTEGLLELSGLSADDQETFLLNKADGLATAKQLFENREKKLARAESIAKSESVLRVLRDHPNLTPEIEATLLGDLALENPDAARIVAERLKEKRVTAAEAAAPAKAPETREIKKDGKIITQEFDPIAGKFVDIAEAERFQPKTVKAEAKPNIVKVANELDLAGEERARFIREGTLKSGVVVNTFENKSKVLQATADQAVEKQVFDAARTAARQKPQIKNLQRLLAQAGQGPVARFLPQLTRVIPGLAKIADPTNEQAVLALINARVLDSMQAFKGSTSERELDFARETIEQLGNTREANAIITRSFLNGIFIAEQELDQFNKFKEGGGNPRQFVFNFDESVIPDHPTKGTITLSDIQFTAIKHGVSMEEVFNIMKESK